VAAGGTALDPEVVTQLVGASSHVSAIATLTGREREVLGLMAEGRSNSAIARSLVISERAVEKHTNAVFGKLGLTNEPDINRRVRAVLLYLNESR